jgi:hypothetical protein
MMRGAWLGKPSPTNSKKRRFFQLSADGATLRWSWEKYVRLFYVEEIACNEEDLTITLCMTADPDLVLKFFDETM